MDLFETLAQWRERLIGSRETTCGSTLEEGVQSLLRWHARRLVAEQMVVLEMAYLMAAHKLTTGDLTQYLGSREVTDKPLGKLAIVTGLRAWARRVGVVFMPLLRWGVYRPFVQPEVGQALLGLQKAVAEQGGAVDLGGASDLFYREGASPYGAAKSLRQLTKLIRARPQSMPSLLEAIGIARLEAAPDIANPREADDIAERLSPPD